MAGSVEDNGGDVVAAVHALRQDVAQLADAMSKLLQAQTHAAGVHIAEAVEDAGQKLTGAATDAGRRACATSSEIEASIERNPMTAVLIAFGVGMSFGLLSRSRG